MGSTAGDSRRRRIAIPPPSVRYYPRSPHRRPFQHCRCWFYATTPRPTSGWIACAAPVPSAKRTELPGKAPVTGRITTGCGRNKAWWQNLRCDGAYGCHLRLLRIIRTIRSVFFLSRFAILPHDSRHHSHPRPFAKADPASLCFSCFSCFFLRSDLHITLQYDWR